MLCCHLRHLRSHIFHMCLLSSQSCDGCSPRHPPSPLNPSWVEALRRRSLEMAKRGNSSSSSLSEVSLLLSVSIRSWKLDVVLPVPAIGGRRHQACPPSGLVFLSNCVAVPYIEPDWLSWLWLDRSDQLEDAFDRTELCLILKVVLINQVDGGIKPLKISFSFIYLIQFH